MNFIYYNKKDVCYFLNLFSIKNINYTLFIIMIKFD